MCFRIIPDTLVIAQKVIGIDQLKIRGANKRIEEVMNLIAIIKKFIIASTTTLIGMRVKTITIRRRSTSRERVAKAKKEDVQKSMSRGKSVDPEAETEASIG